MTVQSIGRNAPDGITIGDSASEKLSFYGTTPVTQRAGTNQASSLVVSTSIGTAVHAILLEVVNTLTAVGLWKGGA